MCTPDGTSVRVPRCALALSEERWNYAERHREAIAAYWQRMTAERPKLFNGAVHVLIAHALREGTLTGTFARTDFKSFLYWRDHGAEGPTLDGFGSSLIRSSDGCVLLGRQVEGHLNGGFAYPPSGLTATGSAAVGFAGVVHEFDGLPDGAHKRVIEQGHEMGRPSAITLTLIVEGGKLVTVRIGGHAVRVVEGELEI